MRLSRSLPVVCFDRFRTRRGGAVRSQFFDNKEAFAELCKLSWYPLYGLMRHRVAAACHQLWISR
jgi:hypothetical protein